MAAVLAVFTAAAWVPLPSEAQSRTEPVAPDADKADLVLGEVERQTLVDPDEAKPADNVDDSPIVLYADRRTTATSKFKDELRSASEEPGTLLFDTPIYSTVLEIVPAAKVGIDQSGVVVLLNRDTNEHFIAVVADTTPGFSASFADPEMRGYWVIDSELDALRVRLLRPAPSDDRHSDVAPPLSADEAARVEQEVAGRRADVDVMPERFTGEAEVPSSFPDQTWLNEDGTRRFSDEELRDFERSSLEPRNRGSVRNFV